MDCVCVRNHLLSSFTRYGRHWARATSLGKVMEALVWRVLGSELTDVKELCIRPFIVACFMWVCSTSQMLLFQLFDWVPCQYCGVENDLLSFLLWFLMNLIRSWTSQFLIHWGLSLDIYKQHCFFLYQDNFSDYKHCKILEYLTLKGLIPFWGF